MPQRQWSREPHSLDKLSNPARRHLLASPDSPAAIEIDTDTGFPTALEIEDAHGTLRREITMSLGFQVGGSEERDPTGGLTYRDTDYWESPAITGTISALHKGVCHQFSTSGEVNGLGVTLHYRLFPTAPYYEIALTLSSQGTVLIRNVDMKVSFSELQNTVLNVPGNMLKRNLPLDELGTDPFGVSPMGGLRGSSGIVALTDNEATTTVWPTNPAEIADIMLLQSPKGIVMNISLNFAADINPGNSAEVLLTSLNLDRGNFEVLRAQWPDWASRYQLTSPGEPPSWMFGAGIYEVQIGTSHFWNDNSYSRYAEIRDLIADLDRVQKLGFSVIQLMPRQPYPSYNVHDYADITTSYGDEQELKELVLLCHERGIRVILDVLLHGVLDNESIDAAVEGVLTGPLRDKLDEEVLDTFGSDVSDSSNYWIAWSRHILDFSEHWRGGSPKRTPLQDTHPEWFATDSEGKVSGVYTKAFDARHPGWQRYFREAMLELVRRTDVDGFRFDAPTYNFFANWAPWARSRAFMSPLGCVPLFVDMRRDLKALKPDALMYTEPSGHLLRRSMDVNYNYDEQWLVSALLSPGGTKKRGVQTGHDFMQWMEDRDDFLPPGSHTAHHIDSHDTFWWPQWGKKWRREQFPLPAVRALTATFLAVDGPYMMFTGGEEGIEEALEALLTFRGTYRHLWATRATFDTTSDTSGQLVITRRGSATDAIACVVNLSASETVTLPREYSQGWLGVVSEGIQGDTIAPFGYLFATRGA